MGFTIEDAKIDVGGFQASFTLPPGATGDTPRVILVEFAAKAHFFMRQDGSASRGLHIIDTRRCKFWIKAWIERTYYLVDSANGSVVDLGDPVRVAYLPEIPGAQASMPTLIDVFNFNKATYAIGEILSFGRLHDKCSDHRKKYENRKPKVISAIKQYLAQFQGLSPFQFEPVQLAVEGLAGIYPSSFSVAKSLSIEWHESIIDIR